MNLRKALIAADPWFGVILSALMLTDHALDGEVIWVAVWSACLTLSVIVLVGHIRTARALKAAQGADRA